jgi:hypothetical protein
VLEDSVLVSIGDNGVGLPPAKRRERTSGLRLIEGLTRQLRGRLEVSTDGGTRFDLHLPIPGGELPAAPAASPAPARRSEAGRPGVIAVQADVAASHGVIAILSTPSRWLEKSS